jgi:hypothetical protein
MRLLRLLRFAAPALLVAGAIACGNSDTTTGNGALGRVSVDAPDSVVSGQAFDVQIDALNIGVQGIHNGMVSITVPAPLVVNSVNASAGTSATFSGGTVTWTLNTLDSNSQSTLHVNVTGTLAAGAAPMTLTVQASMTADGIRAGDAVATDTFQLTP